MNEPKVLWQAVDADGVRHYSEKPAVVGMKWDDVVAGVFKETENMKPIWIGVKFERPDGSGYQSEYKKNGEVWIRTYADNLLPDWFAATAFLLFLLLPVALIILSVLMK